MAYTTKFPMWPLLSLSADWHDCRGWVRHTSQHDRSCSISLYNVHHGTLMLSKQPTPSQPADFWSPVLIRLPPIRLTTSMLLTNPYVVVISIEFSMAFDTDYSETFHLDGDVHHSWLADFFTGHSHSTVQYVYLGQEGRPITHGLTLERRRTC